MSFSCHACSRRLFRAVLHDRGLIAGSMRPSFLSIASSRTTESDPFSPQSSRRLYSSHQISKDPPSRKPKGSRPPRDSQPESARPHRSSAWSHSRVAKQQHKVSNLTRGHQEPRLIGRDRRTAPATKKKAWVDRPQRGAPKSSADEDGKEDADVDVTAVDGLIKNTSITRSAKRELTWLQDPRKLADRVEKLLDSKSIEQALTLTRLASKDMRCTVSWNHILNHHLKHLGPRPAWTLYNEVLTLSMTMTMANRTLTSILDEKEGTETRLLHIPYHAARPSRPSAPLELAESSLDRLSLHERAQLGMRTSG